MHFSVKAPYVFLLISATLSLTVATGATLSMPYNSTSTTNSSLFGNDQSLTGTKPGCKNQCGNLTIPYPFGIGKECSLYDRFAVTCNTSYKPPRTFLNTTLIASGSYISDVNQSVPKQYLEYEILSISSTEVRIRNDLAVSCNYSFENIRQPQAFKNPISKSVWHNLKTQSFSLSMTANILTVVGYGYYGMYTVPEVSSGGCLSLIPSETQQVYAPHSCISGQYCCQTPTPTPYNSASRATRFRIELFLADDEFPQLLNYTTDFAPCSYSFLGEIDKFHFRGLDDLKKDTTLPERVKAHVPLVLEWTIASTNCSQARNDTSSYACQANSKCTDIQQGPGYRCSCLPGYEGNPYLTPGCTDINECLRPDLYPCPRPGTCTNTIGRYICTCPRGSSFNGRECIKDPFPITKIALGMTFGSIIIFIVGFLVNLALRKRKLTKMKAEFFQQNGGLLLKQKLFSSGHAMDSPRIFTAEELKVATKNYSVDRILGKGGYGTVYQGILPDASLVAIKKPRLCDASQVEQFINEVIILAQVNHRNVVKLLGCCLETEMPLLVYEFISNGSLLEHIHSDKGAAWLSWSNCLRVASEAANALVYLHSAASIPIIHRDVKSANILIDESYTAKIADFGASRLVPMDKTLQVTTLVQGTLGYLDPEYLSTSQLTDKSDVYSFGVVLAELLTREKPLSEDRRLEDSNLSAYFVTAMKEARLFRVLYPRIVREANRDQLLTMATLVTACLSLKGEDRPTMKEVASGLEQLRKQISFPWIAHHAEETTSSTGDERDLYPVPSTTSLRSNTISSGHCTMQSEIIAPR